MYVSRQRLRGRYRHLPWHGLARRLERGALDFLARGGSCTLEPPVKELVLAAGQGPCSSSTGSIERRDRVSYNKRVKGKELHRAQACLFTADHARRHWP